jgi:hypothetical protein
MKKYDKLVKNFNSEKASNETREEDYKALSEKLYAAE